MSSRKKEFGTGGVFVQTLRSEFSFLGFIFGCDNIVFARAIVEIWEHNKLAKSDGATTASNQTSQV